MKFRIEETLNQTLGFSLDNFGRASDLVWFIFINQDSTIDYSLHVQCAWRLTHGQRIVIASKDIYLPSQAIQDHDNFDWSEQRTSRFDEFVESVSVNIRGNALVESITANNVGSVKFNFSNNYALEIFPDASTEDEYWRFFKKGNLQSHFVVTGNGIED